MSEIKINLENVLLAKFGCDSKQQFIDKFTLEESYTLLLEAMKLSCDLSIKLASENAEAHGSSCGYGSYWVDRQSILDTIKQIV